METTGVIYKIGNTLNVTEKFKKIEFVVSIGGESKYPQLVQFELHQDKCDLLDQFAVGESVNIKFNLRGRAWTNPVGEVKYFNTLQAWAILKEGENSKETKNTKQMTPEDFDSEIGF